LFCVCAPIVRVYGTAWSGVLFRYMTLSKANKGLITRYIRKMTGYSLAQVKRLIKQYRKHGRLERKHRTTNGSFMRVFILPSWTESLFNSGSFHVRNTHLFQAHFILEETITQHYKQSLLLQFLEGTEAISFQIESKDARYRWIQHALVKFRYMMLSKANKHFAVRFCISSFYWDSSNETKNTHHIMNSFLASINMKKVQ
jgi:hypothetical protein